MIDGVFDTIDIERIERLQVNGVGESRSLDYKETLPGGTESERKEFLADVSSFANALGGDLVFGVVERRENGKPTGVPESVQGLTVATTTDAEQRRLENMLRDGIQPRLPQLRWKWVQGFPKGPVLIVRVPRSLGAPHMVSFQQHGRFYARNSTGKYLLDVFELRDAFLEAGAIGQRGRDFRAERLGRLAAGEGAAKLVSLSLVCVHVIPHSAFRTSGAIDLHRVATAGDALKPLYGSAYDVGFNLDGVLARAAYDELGATGYLQVFRNGIVETVNASLLAHESDDKRYLASVILARELIQFVGRARQLLQVTEAGYPASVLASLTGAAGVTLAVNEAFAFRYDIHPRPFDRDTLLFGELLLTEEDDRPMETVVRPLLDELWQAAGLPKCFDYDRENNFRPHR